MTQSAFWERCDTVIQNLPDLLAEFCHIRTKGEGIQLIVPNSQQLQYQKERGGKETVLKHRQGGHSTWKELEAVMLFCLVEGFSGAIVSHEKEGVRRLFQIVQLAFDMLPSDCKPKLVEDTKDAFSSPAPAKGGNGSRLWIGPAGKRSFGRGDTIHWVHVSELAHYTEQVKLMAGLSQAVPKEGYISIESTPNGRGDHFHDQFVKATDGLIDYNAIFLPWWWSAKEYQNEVRDQIFLTNEEVDLVETAKRQGFDLTHENIQWRRDKKAELGIYFLQEYPEDRQTCFLVTGASVFDAIFIQGLIREAEARPLREERATQGGKLRIWEHYQVGHSYVIGADPAKGRAQGDFSAGVVLDTKTGQHVASLYGRWPEHMFADHLAKLGNEYGDASIAVESNREAVLVMLRDRQIIGYPNLWRRKRWYDNKIDPEYGFLTTERSKRHLCAEFARCLGGDFKTWDTELLGQAFDVLANVDGKIYTREGRRDDLLMAGMIANVAADDVATSQGKYGVSSYA